MPQPQASDQRFLPQLVQGLSASKAPLRAVGHHQGDVLGSRGKVVPDN